MKKRFIFLSSIFSYNISIAGGLVSLGLNQDSAENNTSYYANLNITEKIHRRTFYSGNFGFSKGLINELDSTERYSLYTSHGVGINFTNNFSTNLRIGIRYADSDISSKKISEFISLAANYKIWD
jgi:hypothetical protein